MLKTTPQILRRRSGNPGASPRKYVMVRLKGPQARACYCICGKTGALQCCMAALGPFGVMTKLLNETVKSQRINPPNQRRHLLSTHRELVLFALTHRRAEGLLLGADVAF